MLASLVVGVLSDKLVSSESDVLSVNIHFRVILLINIHCTVQGQRKFIISGFMLFGLSYFFIGPADFIGRP